MRHLAVTLLALVAVVASKNINPEDVIDLENNTAYGYHTKVGIPLANAIRAAEAEEQSTRIVGGSPASLGQFPYQIGIVIDLTSGAGQGVCGGTILNAWRVLTAAHCWWDGQIRAWRFGIVAGSTTLFHGGQRQFTANVIMHASWNPRSIRDDIAMVNLVSALSLSNIVAPIALPSGSELNENFAGNTGTTSGYGRTSDGAAGAITNRQVLSHVNVPIITNDVCRNTFTATVVATNICTSGVDRTGPCTGDSGGPLVVTRSNRRILVGVVSFGSSRGCQFGTPVVYTRVTSYLNWIRNLM